VSRALDKLQKDAAQLPPIVDCKVYFIGELVVAAITNETNEGTAESL
jgi:hypothetical protein